ncbi:hypothetical protein V6X57_24275 [Serratia bockelmannii]|uniref:hypothetical protein n=1 Tax=Serratia bockelmannii TaxID=2703793 RepID=UPI002FE6ACD2
MKSNYTASLQGRTLSVFNHKQENDQVVAILDPGPYPRFYLKDDAIWHDNRDLGPAAILQGCGTKDAAEMLHAINAALLHRRQAYRRCWKRLGYMMSAIALSMAIAGSWYSNQLGDMSAPLTQHVTPNTLENAVAATPQPELKVTADQYQAVAKALRNAAKTGQYTIPLSSGHQRTLYVFADPLCHNCQIIEPALEALSERLNIEIFPVTLVGKQQTVDQVSPVLCQAPQYRRQLWKQLFQADAGISPGENTESNITCDAGNQAIAKNDQAFDIYNLPGTPSLIADDGRYIPLSSLKSDEALDAFLSQTIVTP